MVWFNPNQNKLPMNSSVWTKSIYIFVGSEKKLNKGYITIHKSYKTILIILFVFFNHQINKNMFWKKPKRTILNLWKKTKRTILNHSFWFSLNHQIFKNMVKKIKRTVINHSFLFPLNHQILKIWFEKNQKEQF